ncbi:MAG: hypothetical protein DYG89_47560 [Caldilinea sp. CFX5]|nr:hypothetical protein [Caldilinea sp. CFX5]
MPTQKAALRAELAAVEQELQGALADLYPPLADLTQAQFQRAQPLLRAALVLAVGIGAPDEERLRQQRLSLAAAQEMLFIALSIHKLLLTHQPAQADEQHKTLMGGIILTGDYCFSRSAILAAQTDHVQVVELFSQALKAISEGILRNFFANREAATDSAPPNTTTRYDERRDLFVSGVQAAAVLAALPPATRSDLVDFAHFLAGQPTPYDPAIVTANLRAIRQVTPLQQARLAAFGEWLSQDRKTGRQGDKTLE